MSPISVIASPEGARQSPTTNRFQEIATATLWPSAKQPADRRNDKINSL